MADQRLSVNAQFGCGALILVGIAAYIGALAGSDQSGAQPQPQRPPLFVEGNHVKRMPVGEVSISVVFEVLEVDGPWVKLKADPTLTFRSMYPADAAPPSEQLPDDQAVSDAETNPMLAGLWARFGGEWWMNSAATPDLWQRVPK